MYVCRGTRGREPKLEFRNYTVCGLRLFLISWNACFIPGSDKLARHWISPLSSFQNTGEIWKGSVRGLLLSAKANKPAYLVKHFLILKQNNRQQHWNSCGQPREGKGGKNHTSLSSHTLINIKGCIIDTWCVKVLSDQFRKNTREWLHELPVLLTVPCGLLVSLFSIAPSFNQKWCKIIIVSPKKMNPKNPCIKLVCRPKYINGSTLEY